MTKLIFKLVTLSVMLITLVPSQVAPAASIAASANLACSPQGCQFKCLNLGYFGGTCVTGNCVCFRIPPRHNSNQRFSRKHARLLPVTYLKM